MTRFIALSLFRNLYAFLIIAAFIDKKKLPVSFLATCRKKYSIVFRLPFFFTELFFHEDTNF